MTDEEKAAKVRGLVEERAGVATKLAGVEDADAKAALQGRIDAIDEQLAFYGDHGVPKAKRASKRSGKA